jgi:hypothetical protein
MAAVPPPAPPVPSVQPTLPFGPVAGAPPTTAPVTTFIGRYSDQRFDDERDSYTQLRDFDPMSQVARGADELQAALLSKPDETSRALLVMWQDPNLPTDPGRIVVLHGIRKYP